MGPRAEKRARQYVRRHNPDFFAPGEGQTVASIEVERDRIKALRAATRRERGQDPSEASSQEGVVSATERIKAWVTEVRSSSEPAHEGASPTGPTMEAVAGEIRDVRDVVADSRRWENDMMLLSPLAASRGSAPRAMADAGPAHPDNAERRPPGGVLTLDYLMGEVNKLREELADRHRWVGDMRLLKPTVDRLREMIEREIMEKMAREEGGGTNLGPGPGAAPGASGRHGARATHADFTVGG